MARSPVPARVGRQKRHDGAGRVRADG